MTPFIAGVIIAVIVLLVVCIVVHVITKRKVEDYDGLNSMFIHRQGDERKYIQKDLDDDKQ